MTPDRTEFHKLVWDLFEKNGYRQETSRTRVRLAVEALAPIIEELEKKNKSLEIENRRLENLIDELTAPSPEEEEEND